MSDIITSEDDFDLITLDESPVTPAKVKKEPEPMDSLDDLDLDDNTLSLPPVVDEMVKEIQVKPESKKIQIEKSIAVPVKAKPVECDDFEINLDDDDCHQMDAKHELEKSKIDSGLFEGIEDTKELVRPDSLPEEEIVLDEQPLVDSPEPKGVVLLTTPKVIVPEEKPKKSHKKKEVPVVVEQGTIDVVEKMLVAPTPKTTVSEPEIKLDEDVSDTIELQDSSKIGMSVIEPISKDMCEKGSKDKEKFIPESVDLSNVGQDKEKFIPESEMLFDPMFDISKINIDRKYQTRVIQRSPEQIKAFGEIITSQGQLEPVHLHKEGDEYFLIVGFGRYDAMTALGVKTIKVIIHENLSDSELVKLSTGTNEHRLQLGEWDKIASVGLFAKNHPTIDKDGPDTPNCLTGIFGYSRATVYSYVEMYDYFHDKDLIVEYFKRTDVKQFIFKAILGVKKHITDLETFVKFLEENKDVGKREFEIALQTYISNKHLDERLLKQEINKNVDVGIQLDPESEPPTAFEKDVDKMVKDAETKNPINVEMVKKVSEFMTDLMKNIGTVEETMKNLLAVEDVKNLMDNARIASFQKKFGNLQKIYLKFWA